MTRSSDITSFSEVRQNLRKHLTRLKRTGRPLYVTTNGQTDAVVLSPGAYDALVGKAELADSLASIDRGVHDAAAGRAAPVAESLRDLKAGKGRPIEDSAREFRARESQPPKRRRPA